VSARVKDIARWGLCFAFVLSFHAAGAAALLAHWNDDADLVANAPVITIDLAPMAVAPQTQPMELPPGPEQTEAKSEPEPQPQKPVETEEIKPAPAKDAELTVAPPKPPEKPKQKPARKQASLTSAPSAVEQKADRAAAPAAGALSHNSSALPNWKSALVSQLERYKRYPSEAQARGETGVAQLAFNVDRSGGVHHARIVRSSGSSLLDSATLDLVMRAQPLPAPPPEIQGAQIPIVVPIRYSAR
jgi:periplasmic protein TonB